MDLELEKKIKSRLNDPQKVVVAVTTPRMSFYDFWKSIKPLLKSESKYVVYYDAIHYKKLKPRKRRESWNTRN